jgi:hypothetical protein
MDDVQWHGRETREEKDFLTTTHRPRGDGEAMLSGKMPRIAAGWRAMIRSVRRHTTIFYNERLALFHSVQYCSTLFYHVLLCSAPFSSRGRCSTTICKQRLTQTVPLCSVMFYSVLLYYLVVYVAPPPFVNNNVLVNIALCCAHSLLMCEYNTCWHQERRGLYVLCVALVLPQVHLLACTQCSLSPSCLQTHTIP